MDYPLKIAQMSTVEQIYNHIYPGVDLSVKFASEIATYGNPWAWIKARIQAENFNGILVGDYIPFTLTDGMTFKADVAGIDTYYRYGESDYVVPHHIDFITRETYTAHRWNQADYNNGIAGEECPWLCSDLYAWLNGLDMSVPGSPGKGGTPLISVTYSTTGVFQKLPDALKNVIVSKYASIPTRYSPDGNISDDNSTQWRSLGKLWIPYEVEVHGVSVFGTAVTTGGLTQYPIFRHTSKRIKNTSWWLASSRSGNNAHITLITIEGNILYQNAAASWFRTPLCFRIA